MKLILMRHGKARPDAPKGDAARELTDGGREDVSRVGETLAELGLGRVRALVSPSARTRQTLEAVSRRLDVEPTFVEELYNASLERMIHEAELVSDGAGTALIIGHNPGITALLIHLLDGGTEGMKPGDAAVVELPQGASQGTARLLHYIRPSDRRDEAPA